MQGSSNENSSESASETESVPKKRKRGVRRDDNYKRNTIKRCRVKGLQYVGYSGKLVEQKAAGPPCRCPLKCFTKIAEEQRIIIFEKFYNFNTKDEQDIYLQACIEMHDVQRRSKAKAETSIVKRGRSFFHYVSVDGKREKVCQNAFLSIHGISVKRLKRIKSLLQQNVTPHDKRGHNPKTHAIKEETNVLIRQHIQSFPTKISHYSTKTYKYLDPRLNVKIMHNLFKDKHPNAPVLYSYYVKYFKEHYDLRFGRPQVDTCCKCEELNIKIKSPSLGDAAKRAAVAELVVHKRRSKKFYTSLKDSVDDCKNRDDLMALSFDYMQNVHLPEVPVQELFYLTQLIVNIFGIHNLKTGHAFYYIYHEGVAKKGPNEVCSFLLDYIHNYVPESVQHLRLYSDNCPGQNKHHPMIRMCMALVETGRFETVEQFYPIRGHSFLPNDRDFGLIKKNLRRHDRVFSVHQYTEMIASASYSRKFTVKEVATADIFNFKDWWARYYKKIQYRSKRTKEVCQEIKSKHFLFHSFIISCISLQNQDML